MCVCVCVCSWCSHLIGGIPGEEFSEVRSEQSSYDILNGTVLRRTIFTTDCVCEGQEGRSMCMSVRREGRGELLSSGGNIKRSLPLNPPSLTMAEILSLARLLATSCEDQNIKIRSVKCQMNLFEKKIDTLTFQTLLLLK